VPTTQALLLPLYFISGVFVAVSILPRWLADVGAIFPVRHLADALLVAYNPHTTGLGFAGLDLLVVAAWGVGACSSRSASSAGCRSGADPSGQRDVITGGRNGHRSPDPDRPMRDPRAGSGDARDPQGGVPPAHHHRLAGYRPAPPVHLPGMRGGGPARLAVGRESRGLGIAFPPVAERFERLEETLQICLQMWRGDQSPYRGAHYQLDRPLNSPQSLTRPHPPIMIGGGGERKTLRLVAKYADACNLFQTPDLPRKLDVLRAHCDAEGRDYDEITKTCYFRFDVGEKGEKAGEVTDQLGALAGMGFQAAIGAVANVWQVTPLEVIAAEVIPAVSRL
jgi:hypothetical protein